MAGRERVVSFSIKARDGYSAQMKAATAALDRFRSAQERTSKHRESVQAEKQAIDALRASYKEAADRVARYGEALGRSAKTAKLSIAEERELREEIAGTRARMADLTTEINKRTAALSRMSAVQRAQSAAARNDTAVTALRKEAEAARAAADALRAKEAAHKAAVKAALSRRDDATPVTGTGGGSPVGRIDQDRARMASTRDEAVRLNAEMARLRTSTAVLGKALATTNAPTDEMIRDFSAARARIAELREEMTRVDATMARLRKSSKDVAIGLSGLGVAGTPGRAAVASAVGRRQGGRAAPVGLRERWNQMAADITGSAASSHGRGPLGLRPYELQNLSYQINDFFTQIASGTSATQAFAQQIGQVAQLFPAFVTGLVRTLPQVILLTAALAPLYLALRRISNNEKMVRDFAKTLAVSADGANYDAANLATYSAALDLLGASAEDAQATVAAFAKAGLPEDRIEEFARVARSMSTALGIELPEAASKLMAIHQGSFAAVKELDDQLNLLTASERERIQSLFKAGRAEEARAAAIEILSGKMQRAADLARGPWADAFSNISRAWDGFISALARSPVIANTVQDLQKLADVLEFLTDLLPAAAAAASGAAGSESIIRRNPTFSLPGFDFYRPGWMGGEGGRIDVDRDVSAIVRTVMLEARNNPEAQRDVAAVIMNRMARSGTSGYDVVTRPGQFQPVGAPGSAERARWDAIDESSDRFKAVLENITPILARAVPDPTNGATMFYSPEGQKANVANGLSRDLVPAWATPDRLTAQRHGHNFYTGSFPGDRGVGTSERRDDEDEKKKKAQEDLQAALEKERKERLAISAVSQENLRVQQAYNDTLADAQSKGLSDDESNALAAYAADTEILRIMEERGQIEAELAKTLRETIEDREFELGLIGQTNREAEIAKALRQAEAEAARANLTLTQEQKDAVVDSAAALYDAQAARRGSEQIERATLDLARERGDVEDRSAYVARRLAEANIEAGTAQAEAYTKILNQQYDLMAVAKQREALEKRVSDFASQRAALQEQLDIAVSSGDVDGANALRDRINEVTAAYREALVAARSFWLSQNQSDPSVQSALASIDAAIRGVDSLGSRSIVTSEQINDMIAGGAVNAMDRFAESVVAGESVVDSFKGAFLEMAANFLREIAQMIAQQAILNMLGGGADSSGGAVAGILTNAVSGLFRHSGGPVSGSGITRQFPAALFAGAQRYHTGGIAGLRPNEVPIVAERGEEVLTRRDPRHRDNGGLRGRSGGGGTTLNTKIVNVIDPAEIVTAALATTPGQQVFMNFIAANARSINATLGK